MPVQRTMMAPPRSRIGAITAEERAVVRSRSPVGAKYDTAVNRESAYEMLKRSVETTGEERPRPERGAGGRRVEDAPPSESERGWGPASTEKSAKPPSRVDEFLWGTKRRQGMVETMAKQTARTVGSQLGRQILRGILGGILGSKRAR
jgi:hypothetical protein